MLAGWLSESSSTSSLERGLVTSSELAGLFQNDADIEGRRQILRTIFRTVTLSATGIKFEVRRRALMQRLFEQLYRVERQARNEKPDKGETQADCIRRLRQQHSVPILNALKAWLDDIAPKVLPDSKIGDAVSYTLNQWDYLTRYTENGRMPIDNNLLERDVRIFATGRKSWLFSDTVDGAKASAVVYSLMLTCRACGVEPLAYLRHVLTELPKRAADADITDLLPFNFAKTTAA